MGQAAGAHRYGRIATRMAGGGAGRLRPTHPIPLCLPVAGPSMVARIGFSATTSRESRQGRKAAAAATMSGAGARAGASCLHVIGFIHELYRAGA